eukprot:714678-Rhodomonas_salina.1
MRVGSAPPGRIPRVLAVRCESAAGEVARERRVSRGARTVWAQLAVRKSVSRQVSRAAELVAAPARGAHTLSGSGWSEQVQGGALAVRAARS